ncbi:MAG: hypothetical protein IPH16_15875 [Haliscomenobacter sp.]|nr:hypothetical protein [Haliscomenobacter sp.]
MNNAKPLQAKNPKKPLWPCCSSLKAGKNRTVRALMPKVAKGQKSGGIEQELGQPISLQSQRIDKEGTRGANAYSEELDDGSFNALANDDAHTAVHFFDVKVSDCFFNLGNKKMDFRRRFPTWKVYCRLISKAIPAVFFNK